MSKKQLLLVDGEETTVLQVEVSKKVSTVDFFDRVQIPRNSLVTPVLPKNTRLYTRSTANGSTIDRFIIEEPPEMWYVSYSGRNTVFQIAVPWTIFVVSVNMTNNTPIVQAPTVLFSRNRLSEISQDGVDLSFLPNQHNTGVSCPGEDFNRLMSGREPLLTRLNRVAPYFKNSLFNEDLRPMNTPPEISGVNATSFPELTSGEFARTIIRESSTGNNRYTVNLTLLAQWHLWTASRGDTALTDICNLVRQAGRFNEFVRI